MDKVLKTPVGETLEISPVEAGVILSILMLPFVGGGVDIMKGLMWDGQCALLGRNLVVRL